MDKPKMTEFCKYPEEMLLQILSRMLPKSLMRFKCVRMSWYTLIKSPNLVAKHLSNSSHNKQSTCILCKRYVIRDFETKDVGSVCSLITFYDGDHDQEHTSTPVIEDNDLPLSISRVPKDGRNEPELVGAVTIRGHCDGIVCLVQTEIVLWNPPIKQFKILPEPHIRDGIASCVGFGYDSKSKDYKVLSISSDSAVRTNCPPQVEVYSLSTDSLTEMITDHLESETTNLYPECFQMYFKGIWYWTGIEQQKEYIWEDYGRDDEIFLRQLIAVFDMNDEVFQDILPYSLFDPVVPLLEMRVIAWKESVALFGQYGLYSDNEGGNSRSLISYCRLSPSPVFAL